MGRQITFFILACAIWAYFHWDVQAEFLEIWFELKAAGKVTIDDYDSTWAQFILPRIALFVLIVSPILISMSLANARKTGRA